jgi:hypothetical protein
MRRMKTRIDQGGATMLHSQPADVEKTPSVQTRSALAGSAIR